MRYLVAIPVPDPWRSTLIDVKSRFRPSGWRDTMDPHITLLAPDRPTLPAEEAAAAFTSAKLSLSAFTIQAGRIDRFSRKHRHTLVLRPEPQRSIHQLFQALVSAANWQSTLASTRRDFVSHITVANQLPDQQADDAHAELSRLDLSFEFECQTITLYAKQSNWPRWKELARLKL